MSLPSDEQLQAELMRLLIRLPDRKMDSAAVYAKLAESFPSLTYDERTVPYQNSVSHWANRVQFAVLHLRKRGWLHSPGVGERGVWEVTPAGEQGWEELQRIGADLLKELGEPGGLN